MVAWLKKLNHQPVMMTILVSLLLTALFLLLNHTPLWHTDIWAHLRFGAWMSEHQRFPEREPFSPWSDDAPYMPFAWLSQVAMWKVYEAGAWLPYRWSWDDASQPGGVDFLRVLNALLVALRYLFLYWAFVRLSGSRLISLLGVVFSIVLCWNSLEVLRPQVWGELCLCVVLFLGCRQPPSRLAVWLTPLIMVLWANLHGSYLNGLLILLGLWASRLFQAIRSAVQSQRVDAFHSAAFRRSLRMLLLSILAVGVFNPLWSFQWFHETLAFAGNSNVRCMDEWQRLQWDTPLGIMFMVSIVVVLLTQWLATIRKVPGINMGHGLLLVCFGVQVVFFQRMFPWWAIICPFVCVGPWTRILGCPPGDGYVSLKHRLMQWAAIAGCLWIGFAWSNVGKVLLHEDITLLDQSLHPATPRLVDRAHDRRVRPGVDTALYAAVHQPGSSIFCSETLGDYLLFAKARPVVIYSHVQLFSPQHWRDCMVVKEGIETWEKYLNKWNCLVVCVEAELHPRLCAAVKASPNWCVLLDETHSSSKPNPKSRLFIAIRK